MEVNWCEREDTEDKETTEIITKASDASMGIYRGCKTATALAEPPAWLVPRRRAIRSCRHSLFLSLCLFPHTDLESSLRPDSAPLGLEELIHPVTSSVPTGWTWVPLPL